MESRFRVLLLISVVSLGLQGCGLFGGHKEPPPSDEPATTPSPAEKPVIDPQVERRKIKTPKIKSSDFELGAYGGLLSIEDFGSNSVWGARLAYHLTEDFFLEGTYGRSRAGKTSYEQLSGSAQLLTDSQRTYWYYAIDAGWNILPGEIFIGSNRAYNSAFYVVAGAGRTDFADDKKWTVNWGVGYRVLANNWIACHFDFRDYLFTSDITGKKKTTNNLEAGLGLSIFF